jgi:hypothetical protein
MNKIHIPARIMRDLRERRGLDEDDTSQDQEILNMTKLEFLDEWLKWEGLIGYTTPIMDIIYYAFGIDLESDEVWKQEIKRIFGEEQIPKTYKFSVCLGDMYYCGGHIEIIADNEESAREMAMDYVANKLVKAFPTLDIEYNVECENPDDEEE